MSDIFISYSRKDSEQALALAERLQNEGMSVWIDQRGIEAAKQWSAEIVDAIEACKAFIVLLSSHSVESENVAKELSIAFESKRMLLPVALEDVVLSRTFKYPLAGVQRVAYTQHDAITKALMGCGVDSVKPLTNKHDNRKSLLVMPFDDLSPTQDNLWFADGLAGELIDTLTHIKSLRLIDRRTSRDLRDSKRTTYQIAETLQVRYIVEGSVRKFGDQIKISTSLLDVNEGEHLWQRSHKGTMEDVFELQEQVAQSVVDALKVHLDRSEQEGLRARPTDNPEAYECYLKSKEHYMQYTRGSLLRSAELSEEAVRLDPNFVLAYSYLAVVHVELYRVYERTPEHLLQAQQAVDKIRELEGTTSRWYRGASMIARVMGKAHEAVELAQMAVKLEPESGRVYDSLSFALKAAGDLEGSVQAMLTMVQIDPSIANYNRLLVLLCELGHKENLRENALKAKPVFERFLKLNPDYYYHASTYASILYWTGDKAGALEQTRRLLATSIDGQSRYNLCCLLCDLGEHKLALTELRVLIDAGYSDIDSLHEDPDLDPLRSYPEFDELKEVLRERIGLQPARSASDHDPRPNSSLV